VNSSERKLHSNWCSRRSALLTRGIFLQKILLWILPTLILPACLSTTLTACVFVIRDTVRHPRRFVFAKFVRKLNCSCFQGFREMRVDCIFKNDKNYYYYHYYYYYYYYYYNSWSLISKKYFTELNFLTVFMTWSWWSMQWRTFLSKSMLFVVYA
jgi:hypothetical protein